MRMVTYELVKLWKKKLAVLMSLLLLAGNLFLIYAYEKNTEEYFYIHRQGEIYRAFLAGDESADADGYYRQGQEAQEAYLAAYPDFIDEMESRADRMREASLFQNKESYVYRNLVKSVLDFAPFSGIVLKADGCYGVNAAAGYGGGILFVLLFLAVQGYYVLFRERDQNLLLLLKCSRKGHMPLAAAKLAAMVISAAAFTVLLECSTILAFGWMYGYGDMGRMIQSVPLFRNCTYMLTVAGAFAAMMLIRVLIAVVFTCILFCVGMVLKNEISAAVFLAVILGAEYFFSRVFSISGVFGGIKTINPFYCWDMGQVLGEYYNLNLLEYPVGKNLLALLTAAAFIIVLSAAGIFAFHRTCQIRTESRVEVFLQWLRQQTGRFDRHLSLVYYEFYKVMIQQKKGIVCVVLFLWWLSELSGVFAVKYYGDVEVAAYHVYLQNLQGRITEGTYAYMEVEESCLEELRQAAFSPETDETMKQIYAAELAMHERGFALVQRQLALLEAKPGDIGDKYLLDELAYTELWKDSGTDIVFWFIGTAAALFFAVSIVSVDDRKEMPVLIRSTRNGRRRLEKSKACFSAICTGVLFLLVESLLFLRYDRIDHFLTAKQKLCDFTTQDFTSGMALGVMAACVFILKACSFFAVSLFGKKLAGVMKNEMVAIFTGIGVLGLTALILYHFKWDFTMMFLAGFER
ncbi:MAG: hypothetical protein HDR21_09510 [Lachnospiraceae bacterium]|nr:hypothetical protein [Lachnospiraceae bacterium]MBD5483248.1 hypothetical protein [Lachnospiraceae bacterium]